MPLTLELSSDIKCMESCKANEAGSLASKHACARPCCALRGIDSIQPVEGVVLAAAVAMQGPRTFPLRQQATLLRHIVSPLPLSLSVRVWACAPLSSWMSFF
jgi:hypothetical protein